MIILARILLHVFIAEYGPRWLRDTVEEMICNLLAVAHKKKKLQPRRQARVGRAFLGKATCHSCFHKWTVFTKVGCHPDITMECPKCDGVGELE